MTEPNPTPVVADEVPWSDGITEYDTLHDETYIRLLDADIEGLGKDEMARVNGGAKLVHPGGAKPVHLTLCGTRCWGVVPVVHRRDPRCFV